MKYYVNPFKFENSLFDDFFKSNNSASMKTDIVETDNQYIGNSGWIGTTIFHLVRCSGPFSNAVSFHYWGLTIKKPHPGHFLEISEQRISTIHMAHGGQYG